MLKFAAFIPARLESTRLENKLLQTLGKHSVIATTYLSTVNSNLFDEVLCITNSSKIADDIRAINGKVMMSTKTYETGSDRIAEFANTSNADIIINIQGDEPFINTTLIQQLMNAFTDESIQVVSAMMPITHEQDLHNPNCVKVICDKNNNAILFSRSALPYPRNKNLQYVFYRHIGVYAFRKNALLQFAQLPQPIIEQVEQLENLRFIYNCIPVKMIETQEHTIGIDTQEDLDNARLLAMQLGL